jgi:hypothetical protein
LAPYRYRSSTSSLSDSRDEGERGCDRQIAGFHEELEEYGMIHRRTTRLPIAIAIAIFLPVMSVGSALAAAPDVHPGAVIGHSRVATVAKAGTMTLVPVRGVAKDAWDPNADAASVGADLLTLGTYDVDGCGWPSCNPALLGNTFSKSITPPGGQSNTITVHFSSSDPYTVPETQVIFNGNSYAKWLGASPFNATAITLSDTFHADGLAFWASFPPGVQNQGGDAVFTNSVSNNWAIYHSFSNIKANGLLWNIRETSTATFQFGSNFFSTIATDDSALV